MFNYVYLFHIEGTNVYKIGNSKHPEKRVLEIQTSCPFKVVEVARFESKYPNKVEIALHRKYEFQKEDEEGRVLQGEFFSLSIKERKLFKENCEKFENNFLILENNTYLQDEKKN